MGVLKANPAVPKVPIERIEVPRPTMPQCLPFPLARELTPGLTRENLDKHNKCVGGFERPVQEDGLEPWNPLPRSVTHVEYNGSIGGVLMERQYARRSNQGCHPDAAPRALMSSQIQKADARIQIPASDPGASYQMLMGGVRLNRDGGILDQGTVSKQGQVRHVNYQSGLFKDPKNTKTWNVTRFIGN